MLWFLPRRCECTAQNHAVQSWNALTVFVFLQLDGELPNLIDFENLSLWVKHIILVIEYLGICTFLNHSPLSIHFYIHFILRLFFISKFQFSLTKSFPFCLVESIFLIFFQVWFFYEEVVNDLNLLAPKNYKVTHCKE